MCLFISSKAHTVYTDFGANINTPVIFLLIRKRPILSTATFVFPVPISIKNAYVGLSHALFRQVFWCSYGCVLKLNKFNIMIDILFHLSIKSTY